MDPDTAGTDSGIFGSKLCAHADADAITASTQEASRIQILYPQRAPIGFYAEVVSSRKLTAHVKAAG